MPHAVPLSVPMRLAHGLVPGIFSRVALVSATQFMPGFHCGLLRNVAAQTFAQFLSVIRVNLRIVAPA